MVGGARGQINIPPTFFGISSLDCLDTWVIILGSFWLSRTRANCCSLVYYVCLSSAFSAATESIRLVISSTWSSSYFVSNCFCLSFWFKSALVFSWFSIASSNRVTFSINVRLSASWSLSWALRDWSWTRNDFASSLWVWPSRAADCGDFSFWGDSVVLRWLASGDIFLSATLLYLTILMFVPGRYSNWSSGDALDKLVLTLGGIDS